MHFDKFLANVAVIRYENRSYITGIKPIIGLMCIKFTTLLHQS